MTDERLSRMVESIASWQLELPGGRELLTSTAAYLLAEGIDGPAVVEMASVYPEESRFRIDVLIDNLISELHLEHELEDGPDIPATRWMCRGVLAGEISERNFSQWVHTRFHHESDTELLNDVAVLDDRYDDIEHAGTETDSIRAQIRALAQQILGAV